VRRLDSDIVEAFIRADAGTRRRAMQRGSIEACIATERLRCHAAGKPYHYTDPVVYQLLGGIMAGRDLADAADTHNDVEPQPNRQRRRARARHAT
jgi:hypothetical protein